ncbi:MAG: hypothetical protein ACFWTZ_02240 [Burkholderia sp.]
MLKRMIIYCLYTPSGRLSNMDLYYINSLKNICDKFVLVINGNLTEEDCGKIKNSNTIIYFRNNTGYDFGAWKYAILKLYKKIINCSELVLCNNSCYGPFYDLGKIFDVMEQKKCDFWGMYKHREVKNAFPEHLQSYFLVFKNRILKSRAFYSYWLSLQEPCNFPDAINKETHLTKYFSDQGFSYDSYIDNKKFKYYNNVSIFQPVDLLRQGFPLLKKKVFAENFYFLLKVSNANQAVDAISFLKNNYRNFYKEIKEDLINTRKNTDLIQRFRLVYPISGKCEENINTNKKILIVLYDSNTDAFDIALSHLKKLPTFVDIYIIAENDFIAKRWNEAKNDYKLNIINVSENGLGKNNFMVFWLLCWKTIDRYDYVCFLRTKFSVSYNYILPEHELLTRYFDNIIYDARFVNGIFSLFDKNEDIGLIVPPIPMNPELPNSLKCNRWEEEYGAAQNIYRKLKLTVPLDDYFLGSCNGMMWFRPKAFSIIRNYLKENGKLPYYDFIGKSSEYNLAFSKLYPAIAQQSGFLTAIAYPTTDGVANYISEVVTPQNRGYSSIYEIINDKNYKIKSKALKKIILKYLRDKFKKIIGKHFS